MQRGGPSTGLPTKTEQTDLRQAIYGRNGECPIVVLAAASPVDCFHMAFEAARIAIEHMTPVVLLSDAFIGNGSSAFRLPEEGEYPEIKPRFVPEGNPTGILTTATRNTKARYWAIPGTPGLTHRLGGLEKDSKTGAISTDPENHEKMVLLRQEKVDRVAFDIPDVEPYGDADADTLVIGWGGTFGHIHEAVDDLRLPAKSGYGSFPLHQPLPKNTGEVLARYKHVVVAELNLGQLPTSCRQNSRTF